VGFPLPSVTIATWSYLPAVSDSLSSATGFPLVGLFSLYRTHKLIPFPFLLPVAENVKSLRFPSPFSPFSSRASSRSHVFAHYAVLYSEEVRSPSSQLLPPFPFPLQAYVLSLSDVNKVRGPLLLYIFSSAACVFVVRRNRFHKRFFPFSPQFSHAPGFPPLSEARRDPLPTPIANTLLFLSFCKVQVRLSMALTRPAPFLLSVSPQPFSFDTAFVADVAVVLR